MEPDLVLRRDGMPIAVLDAKWKKLGTAPGAGDLHQVISYGTVVGVEHVGLVYPGRRFIHDRIAIPGSTLHVHLVEVRVVGSHADCAASVDRLSRRLRRLGAPAPRSGDG
jgi:5-methylcytosine-specific restriction endonuclease McrBC regulatory subunit McrC